MLETLAAFGSTKLGGSLITGGLNALGGLLGSSEPSQQKQMRYQRENDLKAFRDRIKLLPALGRASGFNPLTLLGNGGGTGTTQTYAPKMSSPNFLQNALQSGLDTWFNHDINKVDQEVATLKRDLLKEEIDKSVKKQTLPGNFGYSIPKIASSISPPQPVTPKLGVNPNHTRLPGMEANQRTAPVESAPLLWQYRTGIDGGPEWAGLNPDAWEVGIGELIGGAAIHGAGFGINQYTKFHKYRTKIQTKRRAEYLKKKAKRDKQPKLSTNPALTRSGNYGRDFMYDN